MKKFTIKIDDSIGDISISIDKIISEYKNPQKQIISEAFTKSDIKEIEDMVRKQFKKEMMDDVEKKIEDIVKKEIGGKENEKVIMEICQNMFIEFHKLLWVRRSFWSKSLAKKN